jgi:hypothetical protein
MYIGCYECVMFWVRAFPDMDCIIIIISIIIIIIKLMCKY